MTESVQRQPYETCHSDELKLLQLSDNAPKPEGWQLSPEAVKHFILGTKIKNKTISRKIWGNDDVVEKAIVTLIGQRGLLLAGEPGTAKSMLSELLAAAISGNSKQTVQGSAGIIEENIRYSWNYALLLKSGPTPEAMVPGPMFEAMKSGTIMRFEEITRCPTEVQDNLIPIMSDRILHVPEIEDQNKRFLLSRPGFNIIATANLKDRGVNEMSSALKRRFNFITMRPLTKLKDQINLIRDEVNRQLSDRKIDTRITDDLATLLATVFQELRNGMVEGVAVDRPSTVMSMAEAIGVAYNAAVQSFYFGEGTIAPKDLAAHMIGTVIKDDDADIKRFEEYIKVVSKKKKDSLWQSFSAYHPA